jgi:hypothetical protein
MGEVSELELKIIFFGGDAIFGRVGKQIELRTEKPIIKKAK